MEPQILTPGKVFLTKNAPNYQIRMSTPYKSTWQEPLPDDEIGRQQEMKQRLTPGMHVHLRDLGEFIYSGLWDTMHAFYPADTATDLPSLVSEPRRRYLRRDLRGRWFIQLPYTLLADEIILP